MSGKLYCETEEAGQHYTRESVTLSVHFWDLAFIVCMDRFHLRIGIGFRL